MPIMFNALLREAGFPLCDVRLVRHQDPSADKGLTPSELWRDNQPQFENYQSTQSIENRKPLTAPYWAVFVGTPKGKTLFVGIYGVQYRGLLEQDTPMPQREGGVDKAGTHDGYELVRKTACEDLIGKLFIDWGEGRGKGHKGERAFVQYADRHDKPITELRTEFADE